MKRKRFIVFGAHPDDPDLMFGGSAVRLIQAGHKVKFVSVTDGGAGHFKMPPEELIKRRRQETQASAKIAQLVEYQVMDNPDGRLENTLKNREEITRTIRRFQPDVVISHRTCDYHPDHRNTAQLVMDTSFLLRVPYFCPDTAVSDHNPVFAYCYDAFTDPRPVRPDAVVSIDRVMEEKFKLLDCHQSQFYEWCPWVNWGMKDFDATSWTWEQKRQWLDKNWGVRFRREAEISGRTGLSYAEVFELSPYGKNISVDEFQQLMLP